MVDKKRIKRILGKIEKLWLANPDFKFGSLIVNVTKFFNQDDAQMDIAHIEDWDLEVILDKVEVVTKQLKRIK
jgi:hypothetical protein